MKSEDEIKDYKSYLRSQINRMESAEYGNYNKSLLDTYKVKLETLCYLTKQDRDLKDRLAICSWLAR